MVDSHLEIIALVMPMMLLLIADLLHLQGSRGVKESYCPVSSDCLTLIAKA